MYIRYILIILLLILSVVIVLEKNNLKIIIFFSAFSLISASLYFYNYAPDVALAEIAVGSAFVPLIFLITISKQRTFTVMSSLETGFEHIEVLEEFCKTENLKLKIVSNEDVINDDSKTIHGVFRRNDIDLLLDYSKSKNVYKIVGKSSNALIGRLEKVVKDNNAIKLIKTSDEEMIE